MEGLNIFVVAVVDFAVALTVICLLYTSRCV